MQRYSVQLLVVTSETYHVEVEAESQDLAEALAIERVECGQVGDYHEHSTNPEVTDIHPITEETQC